MARRRLEEEELSRAAEASHRAEVERQQVEEQRRTAASEARKGNVPPEPAADAQLDESLALVIIRLYRKGDAFQMAFEMPDLRPNKVDLQIRCPDGKRVRRRFLSGHSLGQA